MVLVTHIINKSARFSNEWCIFVMVR